mmetsp:Transcript_11510/g.38068  ORF Transcript_11510/g.38068 Transcript_11510/m.38068 type:complete len:219 (+) Transcript_11510:326-982(+)
MRTREHSRNGGKRRCSRRAPARRRRAGMSASSSTQRRARSARPRSGSVPTPSGWQPAPFAPPSTQPGWSLPTLRWANRALGACRRVAPARTGSPQQRWSSHVSAPSSRAFCPTRSPRRRLRRVATTKRCGGCSGRLPRRARGARWRRRRQRRPRPPPPAPPSPSPSRLRRRSEPSARCHSSTWTSTLALARLAALAFTRTTTRGSSRAALLARTSSMR